MNWFRLLIDRLSFQCKSIFPIFDYISTSKRLEIVYVEELQIYQFHSFLILESLSMFVFENFLAENNVKRLFKSSKSLLYHPNFRPNLSDNNKSQQFLISTNRAGTLVTPLISTAYNTQKYCKKKLVQFFSYFFLPSSLCVYRIPHM